MCAPSWLYLQKIIQECTVNKTLKKHKILKRTLVLNSHEAIICCINKMYIRTQQNACK